MGGGRLAAGLNGLHGDPVSGVGGTLGLSDHREVVGMQGKGGNF